MELSLDFADVRPSIPNFLMIGLMAWLFLLFIKFMAAYVPFDWFKSAAHAA